MRLVLNNKKSLLAFVFTVSIICSVIFLSFFKDIGPPQHRTPGSDYLYLYEPVADSILQGKGITVEGSVPFLGYPVILSGIFGLSQITGIDRLDLIVLFNVIWAGIAAVFLFLLAWEIFSKKIALIASLLWISYPFNLWFLKNPNTEGPFIPLLFAGLWIFVVAFKKRNFKFVFLGGFILGLASFARPIGLFLPLFLAPLLFFFLKGEPKRKKIFLAAVLLLGNLIAVIPWGVYAFSETGSFIPFSTLGPKKIVNGITWLASPGATIVLPGDVAALVERAGAEDPSGFSELSRFFVQELKSNPVSLLKLIGLKFARSWYATSTRWYEGKILAVQLLYLISGLLGLVYTIKTARNKIRDVIFLSSIIFYFWGMAFVDVSILRYMVPVMGLVVIFSAVTVNILINRLWRFSSL